MAAFNLTFLALLLTCWLHSIKAMGLCDFADKFPCKDSKGSVCFKNPGCKGRNSGKGQTTQRTTQKKQVTTEDAKSIVSTTTPSCPPNMVYANCTVCQSSCRDPKGCFSNCTEPETCVCAGGFLLKGGDCIPQEKCGCFMEGEGVIHEGGFYVNSDCTSRVDCSNGQLVWNYTYTCGVNAVCGKRNSVRQCHAQNVDCLDVFNDGFTTSGVYTVKPTNWSGLPFEVYCNMSDGGGWTVFQRRVDGAFDFYQNWSSYKEGFGSLEHEHWLGNDKIFYVTNQKRYTIRIDLVNFDGSPYYAKYDYFRINSEDDLYRLYKVGTYSGNADERGFNHSAAGISFSGHQNKPFSTHDAENEDSGRHCASSFRGAWWYGKIPGYYSCYGSNLNGPHSSSLPCAKWYFLPTTECNKFVEMKIRPL
ncbi:Ficolin-1 [Holothuria leucospilota]|uniref:Ficolin-1 n=1 Tax=Holothuria leucospilota TaxID=206669 RepID=A0A9Q1BUK6_HOLLE|nr:Ficolin-1 [Holothuria leucospilota]